jgi:hypothetical protein
MLKGGLRLEIGDKLIFNDLIKLNEFDNINNSTIEHEILIKIDELEFGAILNYYTELTVKHSIYNLNLNFEEKEKEKFYKELLSVYSEIDKNFVNINPNDLDIKICNQIGKLIFKENFDMVVKITKDDLHFKAVIIQFYEALNPTVFVEEKSELEKKNI